MSIPYLTGAQLPSTLIQVGIEFDILSPYSGCYICGEVFQSKLDLLYNAYTSNPDTTKAIQRKADSLRALWRGLHAEGHTQEEHDKLRKSGDLMTPEAALRLVPLGIVPLQMSADMADVLAEAPRVPDARVSVSIR
jgi:hypothetical protein